MKNLILLFFSLLLYFFQTGCASKKAAPMASKPSPFPVATGAENAHPYSGSAIELSNGEIFIVFEKWFNKKAPPFESHLWGARVKETQVVSEAKPLDEHEKSYTYHPQFTSGPKGTFLYFNVFHPTSGKASFEKRPLEKDVLKKNTVLHVQDPLKDQFRPWIYPFTLPNNHVILTYEWRDPVLKKQRRKLAHSGDGIHFGDSLDFGIGVMGRTSQFANGLLLYTFQNGDPAQMMDFFKTSTDGREWSHDIAISAQKDVHDAIPLQRADGLIDIYYIASGNASAYSVFRRSLDPSGRLGPEQELTQKKQGSFMAPHPIRLKNGKVFLVLTKEVVEQKNYDLFGLYIDGDAP